MPIINFGGGPITWCHSVGQPVFSIRTTVARLLGPLLILAVCGCTASTMPPTTDDHRVLTQMPDLALTPPSRGPIGATVTLTVYEDYQWGFCARLEPTLQQLLDEYPDTVELVIKPFPPTHSQSSLLAASAVLAAHAQGRFWEFRDQLFHIESPVSTTDLHDIAEQVGIDRPRFFRDLSSTDIQRLLTRCLNDGIHQGVRATPTVFVNQTPITSLRINDLRQAAAQ